MAFTLSSAAFQPDGEIPAKYTCEGEDISPALTWTDLPEGTRSLALIVDDPDAPDPQAPKMTWVHWVLYNLPVTVPGLPEGLQPEGLPAGTRQGLNDWRRARYNGPCPPIGRHRYFHKLYALDIELPVLETPTKTDVEKAMEGHLLGKAELIATYEKGR